MPNRKLKTKLANIFGGACNNCGYRKSLRALQFHHTDSSEKKRYSKAGRVSYLEVERHPERFKLLCANCHFEEHDRIDSESAIMVNCTNCGKAFQTAEHRQKHGRGKYCSKACSFAHRSVVYADTLEKRFWKHIEKTGGCWNWTGYMLSTTPLMYSGCNEEHRSVPLSVRKVSYKLAFGEEPPYKLSVSCGNFRCVNPDHLTQYRKLRK